VPFELAKHDGYTANDSSPLLALFADNPALVTNERLKANDAGMTVRTIVGNALAQVANITIRFR